MDVFSETLIKRKYTPKDRKKIISLFITIIVTSILFIIILPLVAMYLRIPFGSFISMAIFGVIVFLIWRALKNMQLEFEYIVVNDTLDIDKIIAQKKRNREISLELKTVEEIGIFDEKRFVGRTFDFTLRAERDPLSHENFYMLLSHPNLKRTLIVFTPDEKMIRSLHKTLNPRVAKNLPDTIA